MHRLRTCNIYNPRYSICCLRGPSSQLSHWKKHSKAERAPVFPPQNRIP